MKKFFKSSIAILTLSLILTACSNKSNELSINTENITIQSKDGTYDISGVYTSPTIDKNIESPIVIMLHGTGSNKDEAGNAYETYSKELAKSGISSIRFDFIGTGESTVPYENYSFKTAIDDTNTVIAYASTLAGVDSNNIGVLGWSQGGTIALLTAAENSNIKSIATWAGAPDMSMSIRDEDYIMAQKQGYAVKSFDWRDDLKVGINWYNDVKTTDVLAEFSKATAPILAINGSADTVVTPGNANKIITSSTNKLSKEHIIDGADHTFNIFSDDMTIFNDLSATTTEWFKTTLK